MFFAVLGLVTSLSIASTSKVQAEQCWFDQAGGCDTGGVVACGICDDDIPPYQK